MSRRDNNKKQSCAKHASKTVIRTMAKDSRLRVGSNTRERGCTHGSVSAKSMPDDDKAARSLIIWRDDAVVVLVVVFVAMCVPMGANANAVASIAKKN